MLKGLTYENGLLWTESLYQSPNWTLLGASPSNGAVGTQVSTPAIDQEDVPNGLAFGNGNFYAALAGGEIMSINATDHSTHTFAAAGESTPTGLAWDGQYLWQGTDGSVDNLFRIDPATGRIVGSFTVAGGVQGLAWDGGSLWVSSVAAGSAPYVYRYDRSGTPIETFQAPSQLTHLGDLEFDGACLWAADSQNQNLYKFTKPAAQVAPPSLPDGVLSVAYEAYTTIEYSAITYSDSQSGSAYAQMPVASRLRFGGVSSGRCASGLARGYYDSAGKNHYIVSALAENDASDAVSGNAVFTLSQQMVISSARAALPNGTSINSPGKFTLTGLWQILRGDSETDIADTEASLELTLNLYRPGLPVSTIFSGGILLVRPTFGNGWVTCQLTGDMTGVTAVQDAMLTGYTSTATLAQFSLSGAQIPYVLPVNVGETFSIEVIMDSYAFVDNGVSGGAEISMGQPLELQPYYLNTTMKPQMPEPATISLLCLGALALIRRRR